MRKLEKKAIFALVKNCLTSKTTPKVRIFSMLVLATLFALVACQGNQNTPKTEKTATTPVKGDDKATKFAYVNVDTLMERYAFYKDMKKELETKGRILNSDLNNKGTSLQNEALAYKRSITSLTIEQAKRTEQGLAQKEQELMQYQQTAEANFAKEQQEWSQKLNDNVNNYIKKYAEKNGYTFIFSYSRASISVGMMYGNPSLDVTEEVAKGLNAEYKAEKK